MKDTPIMTAYRAAKAEAPDAICLFKVGDFWEAFEQDAEIVARVIGLVITKRGEFPMTGFPYYQFENYLAQLVNAGHRVAVCEQLSKAPKGAKIVGQIVGPGLFD